MSGAIDRSDRIPAFLWPWLVAAVAFGLVIRFVDLGRMPVGYDEVTSLVHSSGYTASGVRDALAAKPTYRAGDLMVYQTPGTAPLFAAAVALGGENPEHPPLYFSALGAWARVAGGSVEASRAFSALLGALLLPATYWLSRRLFESRRTAWMAVALVAVAPIHVLYSQEIRQYGLWLLLVVVSSAVLLEALQDPRARWWVLYAAMIAAGLATHTLFALTMIAHAAYLMWAAKTGNGPKLPYTRYLVATAVGLSLFAPWVVVLLVGDPSRALGFTWVREPVAPIFWIGAVVRNLASPFVDLMPTSPKPTTAGVIDFLASTRSMLITVLTCAAAVFAAFCAYRLCREAPPRVTGFVLAPVAVTAIALVVPDLLFGGRRVTVFRYFLPSLLSLQLAVAHVLASRLGDVRSGKRRRWGTVTAAIFVVAVASSVVIARADTWWTKGQNRFNHATVAVLERSHDPLLLVGASRSATVNALGLAHLLDPSTRMQVVRNEAIPAVDPSKEAVFLFSDPTDMESPREAMEATYELERVPEGERLWRVVGVRD